MQGWRQSIVIDKKSILLMINYSSKNVHPVQLKPSWISPPNAYWSGARAANRRRINSMILNAHVYRCHGIFHSSWGAARQSSGNTPIHSFSMHHAMVHLSLVRYRTWWPAKSKITPTTEESELKTGTRRKNALITRHIAGGILFIPAASAALFFPERSWAFSAVDVAGL